MCNEAKGVLREMKVPILTSDFKVSHTQTEGCLNHAICSTKWDKRLQDMLPKNQKYNNTLFLILSQWKNAK